MSSGRMLPEERLDVDVEVLVDGTWHPGTLEHRRRAGDGWEGFVRWTTGPGATRIGWFPYEQAPRGLTGQLEPLQVATP